jgi:putative ABC transport system substrate-binding protein
VNRRALLAVGAALFVAALPLRAQRSRRAYRVGFVIGGSETSPDARRFLRQFTEGMRELGYRQGRDYGMAVRYYGSDRSRIAKLADELIAKRPDVLVANVSSTAVVLKAKTATIPIVMATAIDPVGEGLVESLARPGGNLTGMTSLSQELHAKLVELTLLLMPKARRIAFLVNPDHVLAKSHQAVAGEAAGAQKAKLLAMQVRAARDADTLADRLVKAQADALIVSADAVLFGLRERIVEAALEAGVPTIAVLAEFAAAGALASYGPDVAANFRGAARYVDRILKGARPGELAIEQPTQFELVLNMKTATAMRIDIPHSLLLRADRVIE